MQGMRCLVSGRVQGVGFRYATLDKALALKLCGSVRNLPDRRVEVLAYGEAKALQALRNWLWQGPAMAQVREVHCETLPFRELHDFSIE